MLLDNTRATSSASPATTSRLAEIHTLNTEIAWLRRWLKVTTALASDAPPDLRGVAQRKLVAMSDLLADREARRDRLDVEQFGAASDHDGYATEPDVEEDGRSSDNENDYSGDESDYSGDESGYSGDESGYSGDESGYSGDDDSDDAHGQLLPVRRLVSPPPQHREYRVISPPPTFLQNRATARSSLEQPSHVAEYSSQASRDDNVRRGARTAISTAGQFVSNRQALNTAGQGAALSRNNLLQYDAPSGRADHVSAPLAISGYRDAAVTENQRGKKRALEVEEESRKGHAANKYDDDDDDERHQESRRPKRGRPSPVHPSFCHSSYHVENRDRVHAASVVNVPTAAPVAIAAPPASMPAALVVAPMP
ncbi:uncharacterized protein PHACADRAFT_202987, partial [Phanerochaete carnosa HHB-10118-sp]